MAKIVGPNQGTLVAFSYLVLLISINFYLDHIIAESYLYLYEAPPPPRAAPVHKYKSPPLPPPVHKPAPVYKNQQPPQLNPVPKSKSTPPPPTTIYKHKSSPTHVYKYKPPPPIPINKYTSPSPPPFSAYNHKLPPLPTQKYKHKSPPEGPPPTIIYKNKSPPTLTEVYKRNLIVYLPAPFHRPPGPMYKPTPITSLAVSIDRVRPIPPSPLIRSPRSRLDTSIAMPTPPSPILMPPASPILMPLAPIPLPTQPSPIRPIYKPTSFERPPGPTERSR